MIVEPIHPTLKSFMDMKTRPPIDNPKWFIIGLAVLLNDLKHYADVHSY